jgi:hypothetical protein
MRVGQIAVDVTPLRLSRDFRWLYAGRFFAQAGTAVTTASASWQIYTLTHSPLAVGLLNLTSSAGLLTSVMAGGMLADRHDRRTLLLAVQLPAGVGGGPAHGQQPPEPAAAVGGLRDHPGARAPVRDQLPGIHGGHPGARRHPVPGSRRRAERHR